MVVDPGKSVFRDDLWQINEGAVGPSGEHKRSTAAVESFKWWKPSEDDEEDVSVDAEKDFITSTNQSGYDIDLNGTYTNNDETYQLSIDDFIEVSFETKKRTILYWRRNNVEIEITVI